MTYRDPSGHTRWRRLRPRDGGDVACLSLAVFGILLSVGSMFGVDGSEFGAVVAGFVLGPLLAVHGSSPVFVFLGLALYLTRGGRSIGSDRIWVWAGFAFTAPLWFLAGQPVTGRSGDLGAIIVLWNLAAFAVMTIGVYRTLRER